MKYEILEIWKWWTLSLDLGDASPYITCHAVAPSHWSSSNPICSFIHHVTYYSNEVVVTSLTFWLGSYICVSPLVHTGLCTEFVALTLQVTNKLILINEVILRGDQSERGLSEVCRSRCPDSCLCFTWIWLCSPAQLGEVVKRVRLRLTHKLDGP